MFIAVITRSTAICIILIIYLFLNFYHFLHSMLISCKLYRVLATLVFIVCILILYHIFTYKFIHSCSHTHTYYFNSALILPSYWPWTRWVRQQVFLKLKLRSKIDSIYSQPQEARFYPSNFILELISFLLFLTQWKCLQIWILHKILMILDPKTWPFRKTGEEI